MLPGVCSTPITLKYNTPNSIKKIRLRFC